MKKTTELQVKAINTLEEVKFRIQTIEDCGEALSFVKKLKEFTEEVETKVKERASEIMNDQNVKQIETEEFIIKTIEPTETEEFSPASVISGLGLERAVAFLKVNGGGLKKYLAKAIKEGALTWEEATKSQQGVIKKLKKGYITISKKKTK